jgi:hypothetical protein
MAARCVTDRSCLALGLLGLALSSCYGVPALSGPFRCGEADACEEGLVCDDGVCCSPLGAPVCRSLVLDDGTCADGSTPRVFFEDLDRDGFGNEARPRSYCSAPVFDPFVLRGGDCNDNAEFGKSSHLGAKEVCDGLDNDCDGVADDELTNLQPFYEDQDNDTFGDPARMLMLCAAAPGFVLNKSDCAPEDGTRHPGMPELCNGMDDDCDGIDDEAPLAGLGTECPVAGGMGVCSTGKTACAQGAPFCQPPLKKPDYCDGLDNDCDGLTDEQPDCGGPANLFATGVSVGGQDTNKDLSGAESGCLKDTPGFSVDTFGSQKWSSSGATAHVAYAETAGIWDLGKPNTVLRLKFSWSMINPSLAAGGPWDLFSQPVIFLCGPSGRMRLVHSPGGSLMTSAGGTVDVKVPVSGGGGWIVGSSGLKLGEVKRVEIYIEPRSPTTGVSQFTVTFLDWGFSAP